MIKYCVVEDNKADFKKSNLEEFIIEFNLKDNIIKNIKIVENYLVTKKNKLD